jgi:hypothetical protein
MKYLKKYKIFEDKHSDVKSDIEDILLELEDYGIEYSTTDVNYYKDGINPSKCIRVGIKDGKDRLFKLDDIMDVLLRLKDYLKLTNWSNRRRFEKSPKYSIEISFANSDVDLIKPMDEFIDNFEGEELYHIYLFIYRINN